MRHVARPVLSEPFWNEQVIISDALMKTYQMDEPEPEKVLKKDLERLKCMNQSDVVEDQLKVTNFGIKMRFGVLNKNCGHI